MQKDKQKEAAMNAATMLQQQFQISLEDEKKRASIYLELLQAQQKVLLLTEHGIKKDERIQALEAELAKKEEKK